MMKKISLLLTVQLIFALGFVFPAHAHDIATFSQAQIDLGRAQLAAMQGIGSGLAYVPVAVWMPPLTIPAGVNWEVGRPSVVAREAHICRPGPTYEVELWQVVPRVLRFSRSGRLISQSR